MDGLLFIITMSALNDHKASRHNSKKSLLHDQSVPILQQFLRHDSRIEYFAPMADFINQPECRLTQSKVSKVEKNRQSRTLPIANRVESPHFQNDYNQISNEFRIDQLEAHYHFIEKALNQQNLNLKCQKDYLSNQVRKLYKREKLFKQQLRQAKQSISELTEQNQLIKSALLQIRHFILNIVTHIQSVMRQRSDQDVLVHSKLLFQQLKDFVADQNSTNSKLITDKPQDVQGYFSRLQQNCKSKLSLSAELGLDSNEKEADNHINKQLQELNDRFQALMYEYKTSNNPELRKKCIQIAKQMKNIKLTSAKEVQTRQSIQHPKNEQYPPNFEQFRPSIQHQMTPASKVQLQKEKNIYISMKKSQKPDLINKSTERISRKLLQKKPLNESTDQIDANVNERGQNSMHKRDSASSRKGKK